jgi:hypothetical protein
VQREHKGERRETRGGISEIIQLEMEIALKIALKIALSYKTRQRQRSTAG